MVTKQLTNKEIAVDPPAQEAMTKEYNKHKNHTWDESKVKEFDEVVKDAKAKNETFHASKVTNYQLDIHFGSTKDGMYSRETTSKIKTAIGPYSANLALLQLLWRQASLLTSSVSCQAIP
eukprot:2788424-Amphidinium_carterae.4